MPEIHCQSDQPQASPVAIGQPGSGPLHSELHVPLVAELEQPVMADAIPAGVGVLSNLRKGSASPLRSVRNVVAAWRGRVLPHSRPSFSENHHLGDKQSGADSELIAGQFEGEKSSRDKGVFDDAFVTIRRMSTRRRHGTVSPAPPYETRQSPVTDQTPTVPQNIDVEKPLPTIRDTGEGSLRKPRGQVVSTYTEMTTEVSDTG